MPRERGVMSNEWCTIYVYQLLIDTEVGLRGVCCPGLAIALGPADVADVHSDH